MVEGQWEGLGVESDIPRSGPDMLGAGESEGGQLSEPH